MRFAALMFLVMATVACSAHRGLDGASPNPAVTGTAPVTTQSTQICSTDGSFDFHVWGKGLASWEGRRVFVAAFEPATPDFGPKAPARPKRRPVRMETTIQGGSFSVACPSSLRKNYAYPSYTVVIDADNDGRCSTGDLARQSQLYGWDAAVAENVNGAPELDAFAPISGRRGPIGGQTDFCKSYFE